MAEGRKGRDLAGTRPPVLTQTVKKGRKEDKGRKKGGNEGRNQGWKEGRKAKKASKGGLINICTRMLT
jgi:hypothetical protein